VIEARLVADHFQEFLEVAVQVVGLKLVTLDMDLDFGQAVVDMEIDL
jgi:hypothetical protein